MIGIERETFKFALSMVSNPPLKLPNGGVPVAGCAEAALEARSNRTME
jgi:hypothetical protein